jgi:tetratricopeptide (TPR) repeat protein
MRGWKLLLGGFLVAALLSSGVAFYVIRVRHVPPAPPEVKSDGIEPAVAALVQKKRDRVLKEPRSATAWGELGEVLLANELADESDVCFAEAEYLDAGDSRWPYYHGGNLLNRGDRDDALPYLRKAVERCEARKETNGAPRLLLAETLLFLGRLDEAEEQFRRALDRDAEDPRAQLGMGLLAAARHDWGTSRDHLLHCLGNPLAQQKASVQLAAVCERLGDAADADKFRAQAERLPKDLDWVDPFITEYLGWAMKKKSRYRRADSLEAAGRFAEAANVVRPMTEDYPDDYVTHLTLAKYLGQLGDFRGAERSLRTALRLAPDKVQNHYYLSLVLLKEGEELSPKDDKDRSRAKELFRQAADLARQALALKPDYGFAHMSLGLALKHLNQPAEALAALRQAVRCNPEIGELHFHLGEALAEAGDQSEASRQWKLALQFAPPSAAWRQTALDHLAASEKNENARNAPGHGGK